MKRIDLNIPQPILMGATYRFWRSEVEHEKARIRALSRGLPIPEYQKPDSDTLVPSDVFAAEFGIRQALQIHTSRIAYLKAVLAIGGVRITLDGQPAQLSVGRPVNIPRSCLLSVFPNVISARLTRGPRPGQKGA